MSATTSAATGRTTTRRRGRSPWTAMIELHTSDGAIFEYACHEGNYAMEGILAGERAKEQAEQ